MTGVVLDANANPIGGVSVLLSGAEDRTTTTDVNGLFEFANLTAGANYNVQPKQPGLIFTEYSQDLVNASGENSFVFKGTPAAFSLSGRVADQSGNGLSNVSIVLNGTAIDSILSDVDGNYIFIDLPADGTYTVSASNGINFFSPPELTVSPLIGDVSGLDFTVLTPTAAPVAISGRVVTPTGTGISGAIVTLTDMHGQVRTVRTTTFGYFAFDSVTTGESYALNVTSRRYRFEPRLLSVEDSIAGLEITGLPF
jgi:hypothetical protein